MIRLFVCFTFLLSFCSTISFSQSKVELTGQVKDAQSKDPLEFCSIGLFNMKDSLLANTATDGKGFFTLSVNRGAYKLIVLITGYKTDTIPVRITDNKFMGTIRMEASDKMLKQVEIKGSTNEKQIDREVQLVTAKMRQGAASAKDVLDKVDGVQVDKYTNAVKVDNSDKVIILVDGVEKNQEYVKNLAPDRLWKIEVIRDPGGRYALEGYSAVINIILKKDYQGTDIFLSNRLMMETVPVAPADLMVQNNSSATVNYTYNRINVYGKYSRDQNNFNLPWVDSKQYTNGLVINETAPASSPENTHVKQIFNNYTLGADFYINPKHTISFESNVEIQDPASNTNTTFNTVSFLKNGITAATYSSENSGSTNILNSYHSLFYVGKLNENNSINSSFTYSNYTNTYTNSILENIPYQSQTNGTDHKVNYKFYLEYTHIINPKSNLMIGYGNSIEQRNNTYSLNDSLSSFKYSDFRNKLYAYYSWQPNKKFGLKIGAAGESSSITANEQNNNYLIFEPYADIRYKPSDQLDIKLKYRVESTYPNITQTNPFTSVIDQQSVRIGNPYLQPEVVQKLSLPVVIAGFLTIEPYYHFSGNYIGTTGTLRKDSIFQYTYSNLGSYQKYGFETHFTAPLSHNFYFKTDFDLFNSSVAYAGQTNNVKDWLMTGQLIYVHPKAGTVVLLEYQHNLIKTVNAQGYDMAGNDFWIFIIKQTFFKKRLDIMLLYFTPITLGVDFHQGNYISTTNYTETKYGDIGFLKNMLMLEVSYRFNKGRAAKKMEKEIQREEEKGNKVL